MGWLGDVWPQPALTARMGSRFPRSHVLGTPRPSRSAARAAPACRHLGRPPRPQPSRPAQLFPGPAGCTTSPGDPRPSVIFSTPPFFLVSQLHLSVLQAVVVLTEQPFSFTPYSPGCFPLGKAASFMSVFPCQPHYLDPRVFLQIFWCPSGADSVFSCAKPDTVGI